MAGRLIGPAPETAKEEEFRSAAHGLVVWALTIVATAALIAVGGMAAGSAAISAAVNSGKSPTVETMTPAYVGYWVDLLFRPAASPSQASLTLHKYAQADTGTATDASPAPQQPQPSPDFSETTPPAPSGPPHQLTPDTTQTPGVLPSGPSASTTSSTAAAPAAAPIVPRDQLIPPQTAAGFAVPASLAADKAESARIIEVGMANDARLNQYDKDRIAALVAQDTGLSMPEAQRRVDNGEARIYADEMQTAETARKIASHASLWIAFSLLFGAFVAGMAAVSARWEDDRVTFGWPRRDPE